MKIEIDDNKILEYSKQIIFKNGTIVKTAKPLPEPNGIMAFAIGVLIGLIVGGMTVYGYMIGG